MIYIFEKGVSSATFNVHCTVGVCINISSDLSYLYRKLVFVFLLCVCKTDRISKYRLPQTPTPPSLQTRVTMYLTGGIYFPYPGQCWKYSVLPNSENKCRNHMWPLIPFWFTSNYIIWSEHGCGWNCYRSRPLYDIQPNESWIHNVKKTGRRIEGNFN